MKVVARIVPPSGTAFLVTIDACSRCFGRPSVVQDRIARGSIYQHAKTRTLHETWGSGQGTGCGLSIPKEHRADVSVVLS